MKPRRVGAGSWWSPEFMVVDGFVNAVHDEIRLAPQPGFVVKEIVRR